MKILVVGGAGYIGSHMLKRFQDTEHKVEVLDNLSTGFETNCLDFTLHKCDLANREEVYSILQNNYDLVMHFASYINVGESYICLLYTSPSPRDAHESRMPSSA